MSTFIGLEILQYFQKVGNFFSVDAYWQKSIH